MFSSWSGFQKYLQEGGRGVPVKITSSWEIRETRSVKWMKGLERKTAEKATSKLKALSF